MNEYLAFIILGLVQGVTEFLPVSSSGHLLLLEKSGIGEENLSVNLLLHCATLLAVLLFYRKQIFTLLKHPTSPEMKFIFIASLPTATVAAFIRYLLPDVGTFLPFFFLLTSVVLLLPRLLPTDTFCFEKKQGVKALFVGAIQGLACFPGLSRSGTTATALLLAGCPEKKAGEYSFLLSVPIIIGSSLTEILTGSFASLPIAAAVGVILSFFAGYFSLKLFTRVLEKRRLYLFSAYTLLLSAISFFILFGK